MTTPRSWLVSLFLCVAGAGMVLLGWGLYRQPSISVSDPFAQMGKSWSPEEIERIHAQGMSTFSIAEHAPTMRRMYEQGTVTLEKKGLMGRAQAYTVDRSAARVEYRADGTAWGEKAPCLIWQFQDVQLDKNDDFGGIELKITDRRKDEHSFHISFLSRTATVPLVPGECMKYVVVPDMAIGPNDTRALDNRKSLDVVFPGIADRSELELHSIRILSKAAGYTDGAAGCAYETLDDETRPVVYQWTDGLLAWDIEVPGKNPVLKFGTGLLPRSKPVAFSVTVVVNNVAKQVFSKTVYTGDRWTDHVIDLSAWGTKHMSIRFKVHSSSPVAALWSSPRIAESGSRGKLFCLYVVDALRADACEGFETFGGPVNATPAIRGLSQEGATFMNAIANAPITKYSMASLFTGLYPSHSGIMKFQRIPDGINTLPEILRANGYVTASFIFNSNAGKLRGLHQGFDYLYDMERIGREALNLRSQFRDNIYGLNPALTSAGMINDFLFNFIRAHQEEDLFVYLHLMDTHAPYMPGKEVLDEWYGHMTQEGIAVPRDPAVLLSELKYTQRPNYSPEKHLSEKALLELYRGAARTADKHLQNFLDFLRSEGRDKETTLVFTSDHGEHLNEHPDIRLFTHVHPMLLEVLRIPLIICSPGVLRGGTVITRPVQHVDVMPTILDLAGIGYEPSQFDGVSLLSLASGQENEFFSKRPIVSQSSPHCSLLIGDMHCPDITRGYNVMVYNIDRDPREHSPLTGDPAVRALDTMLRSLAMVPRRRIPGTDTIITNERALQQLKDLGYVQ